MLADVEKQFALINLEESLKKNDTDPSLYTLVLLL